MVGQVTEAEDIHRAARRVDIKHAIALANSHHRYLLAYLLRRFLRKL